MAKPDKMPQQAIIDGMKGLIDYYYWKGIAVARRWPRYFARTPSPQEAVNQADFAYINRLYSQLAPIIIVALKDHAAGTTQIGKDYLVRAYLKGLFELMPPEYYATEATLLLLLAQLDVALSTRALEAGGNLAAILAQLDVALSTRALEAGGNLAAILAQLDVALSTRALEAGGNLADVATRLSNILTNLLTQNRTWGYMDTYQEDDDVPGTGAGDHWATTTGVAAGEVWVVTHIAVRHTDPAARVVDAELVGAATVRLYGDRNLAQFVVLDRQGSWVLKQGQLIRVTFAALAIGTTGYLYVSGYKMKV